MIRPAEPYDLDRDACYRALLARDARFDGRFYVAVLTTGIYCRPICPVRPPRLENCLFLPSAGAAHQMGFRSCLRCRPELAPSTAGWRGTANTVARALHLIAEGALDDAGVDRLAERLGVGDRHLRRLFDRHVGASPVSVAQAHRILFAKRLIGETALPLGDVALASGFGSVRRFNSAMSKTYGRSPRELRRSAGSATAAAGMTLRLPFAPPYDWHAMLDFLRARAVAGVEEVEGEGYFRTIAVGGTTGFVEVRRASAAGDHCLVATIHIGEVTALPAVVARLRRLFDLDVDMAAVDEHLARDPRLASRIAERPGIRVPGAWDAFELAVRAVLGQQVSVTGATTLAGRMAAAHGAPLDRVDADGQPRASRLCRVFPTPSALAQADLTRIGLTGARARAIRSLGAAMAEDADLLRPASTLDETVRAITRLPGVGPWTAQYIAMRALREPDAFPASDLGLLRAMETPVGKIGPAELLAVAQAWRPWRAYAAMRLWTQPGGEADQDDLQVPSRCDSV